MADLVHRRTSDVHELVTGQESWRSAFIVDYERTAVLDAAPFATAIACGALLVVMRDFR